MDPNQQARQRDAYLRELERRSLDTFMVYNPTEKDFLIEWGHPPTYHRVPAKNKDLGFGPGKMELPRYLMEKYARDIKNAIINQMADDYVNSFREERRKKGQMFRDKYEENSEAMAHAPKTNDTTLIQTIYSEVILGMVREWGKDNSEYPEGEKIDIKTPEETILEMMNKKYEPSGYPIPEEKEEVKVPPQVKPKSDVLAGVRKWVKPYETKYPKP